MVRSSFSAVSMSVSVFQSHFLVQDNPNDHKLNVFLKYDIGVKESIKLFTQHKKKNKDINRYWQRRENKVDSRGEIHILIQEFFR